LYFSLHFKGISLEIHVKWSRCFLVVFYRHPIWYAGIKQILCSTKDALGQGEVYGGGKNALGSVEQGMIGEQKI